MCKIARILHLFLILHLSLTHTYYCVITFFAIDLYLSMYSSRPFFPLSEMSGSTMRTHIVLPSQLFFTTSSLISCGTSEVAEQMQHYNT